VRDEQGVGFSIYAQGDSLDDLKTMVQDAVRCHFEDEESRPRVIRLHLVN